MSEIVTDALESAKIEPREVQTAHVGNFAAELYSKQGQLGAFFLETDPSLLGTSDQPPRGRVRLGIDRDTGGVGRNRGGPL